MIHSHNSACSAFVDTIDDSYFVSEVELCLIHIESLVRIRRLAVNQPKAMVAEVAVE